jgi:hypothetical protein
MKLRESSTPFLTTFKNDPETTATIPPEQQRPAQITFKDMLEALRKLTRERMVETD